MPLSAGDKLGPYEVIATIGAGGMGEVYKARDTRLDRTVAIKVLPDHIAKRDDLRVRFEREARAVASLNHPHICTLHDIGPGYMVMELIEGESLAARIEKGAIPLDQALQFAAQIADALDRAHRAGVTHRDVKPQNIMLTRNGVKVLDFGLAKSVASKPGPTEETLTAVLTTAGTIMATPQYMAPEQFAGKEADARSDIWAFGAVVYEMVTGRKAFQGSNYQSLVGAILATEPAPMAVRPITPSWLERFVRRCLAKDPDDRWQTMRDIVIELRSPPEEVVRPLPNGRGSVMRRIAGGLALGLLATGVGWFNAARPAPPRPLMRLDLEVPSATSLTGAETSNSGYRGNLLALSPDGARLALTLRAADGKVRIHTRWLHQKQFTPLAGTENASGPFFSPAGDWIGFFADGKLKKVAVEGGAAVTLCDAPYGLGASWGDDGNIIAALQLGGGLYRIPAAGGSPVPVTKLTNAVETHRWPQILPGSQEVLFTVSAQIGAGYDDASIEVVSLRTGERKTLHRGGFFGRYLANAGGSGHLVYLHQSTLFAAPVHSGSLAMAGAPTPIVEEVSSGTIAGADFAFAQNGTFVYLTGKPSKPEWPISWVGSVGKLEQPLHAPPGQYVGLRLSPDGKRLAFVKRHAKGSDIWVKDLDRDTPSQLSFLPGVNSYPLWTPDGKSIVFRSLNAAAPGLYAIRSDGSGEAKRLTEGKVVAIPYSFSPNGKRLAFTEIANGTPDLFTVPVESEAGPGTPGVRLGKADLFLGTPGLENQPAFSPDGRWLAHQSNESGSFEIYVRPFPGPGGRWLVSSGGGRVPLWSRDGRQLFYQTHDGRVMAVDYTTKGDSFTAGKPRLWTESRLPYFAFGYSYDITPDGKRLAAIVNDTAAETLPTHLTFLLNFTDELRRRAPEGK